VVFFTPYSFFLGHRGSLVSRVFGTVPAGIVPITSNCCSFPWHSVPQKSFFFLTLIFDLFFMLEPEFRSIYFLVEVQPCVPQHLSDSIFYLTKNEKLFFHYYLCPKPHPFFPGVIVLGTGRPQLNFPLECVSTYPPCAFPPRRRWISLPTFPHICVV